MAKTLPRIIREYVGQHPGCMGPSLSGIYHDTGRVAGEVCRLLAEGELMVVNGRLYLSSVRTVSSPVCK